ncbi:right-handed parallel beta-helix repeat-containing protein [Bremerella cremea]|uniref:Right-handed parallel beta-helix repeat-containing protein n=1 Tax=Bremerella cremea TaxID=1031537 RepID=A0A368KY82_9BACT|nr:right-handed parallel beta-helix repeat-containing protein [Bremerella cremea]RCS54707.1 right-handed parallel beta-helix repeat-containing protein [Bremerella cremea]
MRRFALVLLLVFSASSARGGDIFVNNVSGDDRNTGLSDSAAKGSDGPTSTIAKALRIARKGDRIILANTGVPYKESISLQGGDNSGWDFAPFVLQGNGAVLDGTAVIPIEAWKFVRNDIYCFAPTYKQYQQLYLNGKPAKRVVLESRDELDKLEPMTWDLVDGIIFFRSEQDVDPGNYRLSYTAQRTGITLYEVRHVQILDLTVQGFQLDGINAHSNCYNTQLVSITSRGNGRSGVSVGGASKVTIARSLLGDNATVQLRGEGFSKTTVLDCTLLENTAPATFHQDARIEIDRQEVTDAQAAQTAQTLRRIPRPDAPASALQR